jgi:ABC-type branched-subunit amino acid transport system substrate-binding protein
VQPQETIFGLTRRFEIGRDSLIALNPALADGLKSGMVLKVPTKDAKGKELDLEAYDKTETATAAIVDLSRNIKYPETKNIVLMLPFNLEQVKKDTVSNAREVLQKDRVMRISLDFHSGVLMAVERAKELGVSTRLRVFDTQQKPGSVANLIYANDFDGVDAVIGPLLKDTSEEGAVRLANAGIPVISPITNRELKPLPNLYQAGASDEMLREAMISYLKENSGDKNVIIVTGPESYAIRNRLQNALPQAKTVSSGKNNISESVLSSAMVKDRENWVILESESVALLGTATSALNRLTREYKVTLFTTHKNGSFESDIISNEDLGRLNFHYPSEYRQFDELAGNEFIENYRSKYGVIPNKYAVRGYDLTLDVILRLAAMKNLKNSVAAQVITEYVENKFHYQPKPGGGFYNDAIYILKLNEDLSLSVKK